MGVFDLYIKQIGKYILHLKKKKRAVRIFESSFPVDKSKENLPLRTGNALKSEVILRSDTYIELGGPSVSSSSFTLWTKDPSMIRNGRITLIGPDIKEKSGNLPFGQVVLIGGENLDDKDHDAFEMSSYIGNKIEGYMIRSTPGNIWTRISKTAAEKGFSFEVLGKSLMYIYKSKNPGITSMEILFVTSENDDVQLLNKIEAQVKKIGKEITRANWEIKGYDIDCVLDCSTCADKPVCDDIRDVLKIKKRQKTK